jgi:hypothetical protein
LKDQLFDRAPKVEQFSRLMQGSSRNSLPYSAELLDIFVAAFLQQWPTCAADGIQ